jgi:hypothetical protein
MPQSWEVQVLLSTKFHEIEPQEYFQFYSGAAESKKVVPHIDLRISSDSFPTQPNPMSWV